MDFAKTDNVAVRGGCKPWQTSLMKAKGVDWAIIGGRWYMVCKDCGGNCGQCGLTGYVDNVPAEMQNLINNLDVRNFS